jgi:hypothetical protein
MGVRASKSFMITPGIMGYSALVALAFALAACSSTTATTTTQQAAASVPTITCAGIHSDLAAVVTDLKAGYTANQEAWASGGGYMDFRCSSMTQTRRTIRTS